MALFRLIGESTGPIKFFCKALQADGSGGAETDQMEPDVPPYLLEEDRGKNLTQSESMTMLLCWIAASRWSKTVMFFLRPGDIATNSNRSCGLRHEGVALQPVATINVHSNSCGRHSGACPIRSYAQSRGTQRAERTYDRWIEISSKRSVKLLGHIQPREGRSRSCSNRSQMGRSQSTN